MTGKISDENVQTQQDKRWLTLYVLCAGVLMIVLDTTIVNVALPSIQVDLAFNATTLVWIVNAYMLTFGGFLLLGGRLSDLYGHRRLFLLGLSLFTVASLVCGLANSQGVLITARAVQGLGGAVVATVALSLIMTMFTEPGERAKAMGIYGFVCAGGGSIGVLLGGLLTNTLNWHWIFLVNIPIGAVVYVVCRGLIPQDNGLVQGRSLDVGGAITITASLMLAVYGIVNGNEAGWLSNHTIVLLAAAVLLFVSFVLIEARAATPLMPLHLVCRRNIATANVVGMLWSAGMFAWFFISALYMQLVLGYSALQVGLAFLPANVIMALLSLGLSSRIVMRFGIKVPLVGGLLLASAGLALFSFAPVNGTFAAHVLPGMLLLGFGCGVALNPLLLAAMSDVSNEDSGLASGIVNTSFMMGGALGLAILASIAAARTLYLAQGGLVKIAALTGGYQLAFMIGALFALGAAVIGALLFKAKAPANPHGVVAVVSELLQPATE